MARVILPPVHGDHAVRDGDPPGLHREPAGGGGDRQVTSDAQRHQHLHLLPGTG